MSGRRLRIYGEGREDFIGLQQRRFKNAARVPERCTSHEKSTSVGAFFRSLSFAYQQ